MKLASIANLIGKAIFVATACSMIIVAGGGVDFLRRRVGIAYLALSAIWWLLAVMRRQGASSAYDRKQRTVVLLGGVFSVPILLLWPSWEYSHLAGPIPRDGTLAWAGLALFAAGIALQTASMWTLRHFFAVRLGMQPGHYLVTEGPYRLVRHPGYLSYLLSLTGIGLAMSSVIGLGLTVLIVPFLLWRIEGEEEMLLNEFGKEYRSYIQQTKRLIPLVY